MLELASVEIIEHEWHFYSIQEKLKVVFLTET
jgi:hypothetical protein